jgi:hypothetical protein
MCVGQEMKQSYLWYLSELIIKSFIPSKYQWASLKPYEAVYIILWVSEWFLLNAISKAISLRKQVNFQWDDYASRFVLDKHDQFDSYNASSLRQQFAYRHVAPLGHINMISNKAVFALSP